MKTTITYNIPDEKLDSILEMLGYSEGSKEDFMNEAISSVVIPAIADRFITIKQTEAQKMISSIPSETTESVKNMISITTV